MKNFRKTVAILSVVSLLAIAGCAKDAPDLSKIPVIKRVENVDYIKNDNGVYATITLHGFTVLSEGFDKFSELCDLYCATAYDKSLWYAIETSELVANDDGSEYENIVSSGYGWTYQDMAYPTRTDDVIFSFYNETYAYNSNYDWKYVTTGHVYDIESAKEVFLSDAIKNPELFCDALIKNQLALEESDFYYTTWQDDIKERWNDTSVTSWYLTDSALHVVFSSDLLSAYYEVNACIPYETCADFLDERYINKATKLCHAVTEYGLYGREYRFDADKDGVDELFKLEIDVDVDEDNSVFSLTPIILFGRGEDSLLPIYGNAVRKVVAPYIIETDKGNFFLYLETTDEEGNHELSIYGLNNPDGGAVPLGENKTGAFYYYVPCDSNRLVVTKDSNSASYMICHVDDENGQLVIGK